MDALTLFASTAVGMLIVGTIAAVYIGRENGRKRLKRSKWANPYKIGDPFKDGEYSRRTSLANYHTEMLCGMTEGFRLEILGELTGKPLACWCRRSDEPCTDDNMCHGDVLVELWKEANR